MYRNLVLSNLGNQLITRRKQVSTLIAKNNEVVKNHHNNDR